jgi:hypothetical protein
MVNQDDSSIHSGAYEYKQGMKFSWGEPVASMIKDGKLICRLCGNTGGQVHPELGIMPCRACETEQNAKWKPNVPMPEFIPTKIKDDRKKYFKTLLQPHRGGENSREYAEAYPEKAKEMWGEEGVKKSKYVWSDLSGWNTRDRSL